MPLFPTMAKTGGKPQSGLFAMAISTGWQSKPAPMAIALLGKGRGHTMAFAFYALLIAGLAIGIYGVIDAVRNLKGPNNG